MPRNLNLISSDKIELMIHHQRGLQAVCCQNICSWVLLAVSGAQTGTETFCRHADIFQTFTKIDWTNNNNRITIYLFRIGQAWSSRAASVSTLAKINKPSPLKFSKVCLGMLLYLMIKCQRSWHTLSCQKIHSRGLFTLVDAQSVLGCASTVVWSS